MDIPKNLSLNAQTLILGNRSLDSNTEQVNIVSSNGTEVKINGVVPGGGGDDSLPITGTGDISITGNIKANGDGISTGKLEGVIIKATSGNIIASSGNVEVLTGNVEISGTGGLEVNGTGKVRVANGNVEVDVGNVEISGTGGLKVKGTGEIKTEGGGNITAGLSGDVQTTAGDIVSGNKIFFDGDDIYHRTNNPSAETSYVTYKQLPQLNVANTFTGANKFDTNVNEFSQKVSVGTRDAGGLFTQKTAINSSGNIECVSLNNGTSITTGTITCDNGGTNSCAAKTFTTRTSGLAGWTIEQQTAQGNPLDNILQFKGGQAGAYITINDSAFAGSVPNISLDPRTEALGGQIQTDLFTVGDGANAFNITQPKSGADSNNLLIQAGAANTPIKFQNNAGTTDLVRIEPDGSDGSGRIYCPAIFFGTTGVHNSIVNDVAGPESLVLKIRQATASSEVIFLDNDDAEIIRIQKTQVELGNTIPILFGNYSFRPIQYSVSITSFPIEQTATAFSKIFTSVSTWTNINTGATGQSITEGFYKLSVTQTAVSSPVGSYEGLGILCDFVYIIPADALPNNALPNPLSFSYKKYLTAGAPQIEIRRNATGGQDVHLTFPTSGTGGESMPITVKLTKMDY